ncbi:GNAT family N-acetyltransferase [Bifidobacterium crudilactis]|jgi:predicted acetyltransferase|uniref:GNAT family N-acetyltransferase n=1 Tax=Bifidobacterium crudilactis TaxID=327277 RepID=UPI00054E45FD|nr:GNAT family N-acetyltransferase [Bifidobacterium crudilactis]MCI2148002.1 GNAT family N-acetyltransferase [Bifidobacterium crudilactis]MCI2158432.1 GNAT family N-acetyltransferase [Bifidobacterium crudilactis]
MQLIEMWRLDADKVFDLVSSFPQDENGFENDAWNMQREDIPRYLHTLEDIAHGKVLHKGWVPATKFVLLDDDDNAVGIFNLRHRLNAHLRSGAGHIGYGIARAYRGRGYASKGLHLCLLKAKTLIDENEVYMSVLKTNRASLAVQLKNGARIDHEDELEYFTRITL